MTHGVLALDAKASPESERCQTARDPPLIPRTSAAGRPPTWTREAEGRRAESTELAVREEAEERMRGSGGQGGDPHQVQGGESLTLGRRRGGGDLQSRGMA